MVVRAHDLKVNTFCKTEPNIKHSGCQFSTLEEAGEVFGNTHGKRNPVVVSVTNKIQVCCDTEHQLWLRWNQCVFLSEAAYFSWYSVMKANYRKV